MVENLTWLMTKNAVFQAYARAVFCLVMYSSKHDALISTCILPRACARALSHFSSYRLSRYLLSCRCGCGGYAPGSRLIEARARGQEDREASLDMADLPGGESAVDAVP